MTVRSARRPRTARSKTWRPVGASRAEKTSLLSQPDRAATGALQNDDVGASVDGASEANSSRLAAGQLPTELAADSRIAVGEQREIR